MEFRKMVTMSIYVRQQKRHRCTEQSFVLCGRRQGWDDVREWHWNMYIIISEMDHQSRFDAWDRVLGAGALGWPRGKGCGGRWEWEGNRQEGQGSPNGGKRLQVPDIFISLKRQEETNQQYVFPSLYKFKRRFLLTCCVALTPGLTWS